MAPLTPEYLLDAVSRLTGDTNPIGNHVRLYRIKVQSSDGKTCGIPFRVSPKKAYKSNLRQIADSLRMEVEWMIEHDVLDNWTAAEVRSHMAQFPAEILDSVAGLRRFREVTGTP